MSRFAGALVERHAGRTARLWSCRRSGGKKTTSLNAQSQRHRRHGGCSAEWPMRRLEARFHPSENDRDDYVIVGHLIWTAARLDEFPLVEPAPSLKQANAPHAILQTLRHLIRIKGPSSFERLASLLSAHWSFVEVSSPFAEGEAAKTG